MGFKLYIQSGLTLLALTIATVQSQSTPAPHLYFENPIVDHTSADPYIYLHTDGFYYYVISMDDGITVLKNDILTNWRDPVASRKVYSVPQGNANLWAPEIHHINGEWYIYFTMGTGPIPTQRMWVIQALNSSDPLGNYTDATRYGELIKKYFISYR